MEKIKLNQGSEIPPIGFGVYQTPKGEVTKESVKIALDTGYRHIDTAAIYGNEADVGAAIKESGISREETFVTTKLWNSDHSDPQKAIATSLEKLGFDYVDLYLMHWPVEGKRIRTWSIMEKFLEQGKAKEIGVSNFTTKHLEELLKNSSIVPTINQVEFSPYLFQADLMEYCKSKKIQIECYSPLTQGRKLADPKLVEIAKKYSKSTAQILIKWSLQHDLVVLPKSKTKERIIENFNVFDFEISKEDMDSLDGFNENLRVGWDPTDIQ